MALPLLGFLSSIPQLAKTGKFWVILFAIVFVVGVFGYAYYNYTSILEDNGDLRKKNSELTTENTGLKEQNKSLKESAEKARAAIRYVYITRQVDETTRQDNEKMIDVNTGNIVATAKANRTSAEQELNRLTSDRNRCLEISMGSPIKESELKVKPDEQNKVCPKIFNYPVGL